MGSSIFCYLITRRRKIALEIKRKVYVDMKNDGHVGIDVGSKLIFLTNR